MAKKTREELAEIEYRALEEAMREMQALQEAEEPSGIPGAEAATAVADYLKDNNKPIVYITVMNALSVDCDCDCNQGDPVMKDLGIIGSLDPVANDQAFIDMVWNSNDPGAHLLQERIDRQQGREILPYAENLGLGSREYELIEI